MPELCVHKLRELEDTDFRLLQEVVPGLADEAIGGGPKACFRRTVVPSQVLTESAAIRLESDLLLVSAANVNAKAACLSSTIDGGTLQKVRRGGCQKHLSLANAAIVRPTSLPRS